LFIIDRGIGIGIGIVAATNQLDKPLGIPCYGTCCLFLSFPLFVQVGI
jgi:hypothetical protein